VDFEAIKKHPYAIGSVVIIGGIVVFYLVGSGGSSSATQPASNSNYAAALQADTQLASAQAGVAVQQAAQQAQLQQTQIQAQVANTQTAANLDASKFGTLASLVSAIFSTQQTTQQQANQEVANQNLQALQDSVLTDQLNQQANLAANTNATNLAGLVDQLNYGTNLAQLQVGVVNQAQQNQLQLAQTIIPLAGQQKNSALDATNQTNLFQTILSGGNAGVATSGVNGTTAAAVSGNNTGLGTLRAVTSLGTSLIGGLFG
jgi:hypothetical protein